MKKWFRHKCINMCKNVIYFVEGFMFLLYISPFLCKAPGNVVWIAVFIRVGMLLELKARLGLLRISHLKKYFYLCLKKQSLRNSSMNVKFFTYNKAALVKKLEMLKPRCRFEWTYIVFICRDHRHREFKSHEWNSYTKSKKKDGWYIWEPIFNISFDWLTHITIRMSHQDPT